MADNATISDGISGTIPVAGDDVGGVKYQRVKISVGADGSATDATAANPIPVDDDATQTILTALQTVIGATGDAASTGAATLNAHLRSIAAALAGTLTVTGGGGGTQFAEDAAHTTGDLGTMSLAVRNDAGTALAGTTGDYIPLSTDSSGSLRVTGAGGGTQYVEDAASSGGETVTLAGAIRQDSLASSTSATGDFANLKVNANGELYVAASGSISVTGTMPVQQAPATSGGYTIKRTLAAASTNATSVKASAGQVFGWYLKNSAAYDVFLKLYNKASSPTVGTDTPVMTIGVPAGAGANVEFLGGIAFATGIAFAITKLVADADTTVVVANDLIVNLFYV